MSKITIENTEITVVQTENGDYICLTDMLKAKDGEFFVTDWLRNRNTLEYIDIWEQINNSSFNYGEFAIIKSKAGLNNFKVSIQELVERGNIICLQAKTGRYGGTYAHKDIAFHFGMWISPKFQLLLVKEFQRLKEQEQKLLGWNAKRELAKINYRIHTDAIKENLIPKELTAKQASIIYANEADVLNIGDDCNAGGISSPGGGDSSSSSNGISSSSSATLSSSSQTPSSSSTTPTEPEFYCAIVSSGQGLCYSVENLDGTEVEGQKCHDGSRLGVLATPATCRIVEYTIRTELESQVDR